MVRSDGKNNLKKTLVTVRSSQKAWHVRFLATIYTRGHMLRYQRNLVSVFYNFFKKKIVCCL